MPTTRVYLDSCCFIEMIKGERGATLDHPDDADMTARLLRASRDGKIECWTSLLAVAEVLKIDKTSPPDEALKDRIERLLLSGRDGVFVHGLAPPLVIRARDLYWQDGLLERAADRVHIATALDLKCDEILSVDDRLAKRFNRSSISGTNIRAVKDTRSLPFDYRQDALFSGQGDAR